MSRKVSFKVSNGLDSAVRVLTTLRRKNFSVTEFSMKDDNGSAKFEVSLDDLKNSSFESAILYVKRMVDVSDVIEIY